MLVDDLSATELLVWGAILHLFVDWLLQNEWMADHKLDLRHPAGYVHASLHLIALAIIFPLGAALALAVAHLLIDTRRPLGWWSQVCSQPQDLGPIAISVHIWRDQTLHLTTIAIAALIVAA
jgi:hypothetical protein